MYTIPIAVTISPLIYPGTKISLQYSAKYKSDTPGALQQKTPSRYTETLISKVPTARVKLVTQHASDVVSIGETVQIHCLVELPSGMMDLSVHVVGEDSDSVLMSSFTSNFTHLEYQVWKTIQISEWYI